MDLPCSTGHSTQYCVMACMRRESSKKRMDIRICITYSLGDTPETQHCESTILQFKKKCLNMK